MKKLLTILSLLITSICFSQTRPIQPMGTKVNEVKMLGALSIDSALFVTPYATLAAANVSGQYARTRGGSFIFVKNENALYVRNDAATAWIKIAAVSDIPPLYTDEMSQDAVGAMINTSLQYIDGTPLLAIGDRDYGDVSVTGSGLAWNIDANAVTFNKFVQGAPNTVVTNPLSSTANFSTTALAANNLLGRGSTGNIAPITIAGSLSFSGTVLTGTGITSEVDGSTTNELQTIANTSNATSHTVTLSNSGGSVQFIEGTGITLTTAGTGAAGTVTIASSSTLSLTAIGTTPNANAATLASGVLNLEPASTSFGGVVTTGAQSFAGTKTFTQGLESYGGIHTTNFRAGVSALNVNISGADNVAVGYLAMYSATTSHSNVAVGSQAFQNLSTSSGGNVAIGALAGHQTTTANANTFVGNAAGQAVNSPFNVAIGAVALVSAGGGYNVAVGGSAMQNSSGAGAAYNVAVGYNALLNVTSGSNVGVGVGAGTSTTSGTENVYVGANTAVYRNASGNVIIGFLAGHNEATGNNNVYVGRYSGYYTAGSSNIFIGYNSGMSETGSNRLIIENSSAIGSTGALIYGEFDNDLVRVNGKFEAISAAENVGFFNYTGGDGVGGVAINAQYFSSLYYYNSGVKKWQATSGDLAPQDGVTDYVIYNTVTDKVGIAINGANNYVGIGLLYTGIQYGTAAKRQLHVAEPTNVSIIATTPLVRLTNITTYANTGFGTGIETELSNSVAYGYDLASYIETYWTDGTIDSEDAAFRVSLMQNGAPYAQKFQVLSTGEIWAGLLNNDNTETKIVTWNSTDKKFEYRDASGLGGSLTLAPIGSTPNANAATYSAGTLNLEPASAAFGGVVTTGTQSFAGFKSFTSGFESIIVDYTNFRAGAGALGLATVGYNTAVGYNAGYGVTTAGANTLIGYHAGHSTNGTENTSLGFHALAASGSLTGGNNIAIGARAMLGIQGASSNNIAIGSYIMQYLNGGANNIAMGMYTGNNITTGSGNILIGQTTGNGLGSSSSSNVIIGTEAFRQPITGNGNVAIGMNAGYYKTGGDYNTFVGTATGITSGGGSLNVFIGYQAGTSESGSNRLYIENSSVTTPLIYGEFDNDLVRVNGQLNVVNYANPSAYFSGHSGSGQTGIVVNSNYGHTYIRIAETDVARFEIHTGDWLYPSDGTSDFFIRNMSLNQQAITVSGANNYVGIGADNTGIERGLFAKRRLHVIQSGGSNIPNPIFRVSTYTTIGNAVGGGAGIEMELASATAFASINASYIGAVWSDVTASAERADFTVNLMHNGAAYAEKMRVLSTGELKVQLLNQDDAETKIVTWNSTDKILEWRAASTLTGTGGGGYTNMTEFLTQTPYRLFVSDVNGDVQEMAFGTAGQLLTANGASASLTWTTPSTLGEANTVSSLGGGVSLYSTKVGVDLRFNSLNTNEFLLSSNLISINYTGAQAASGTLKGFLTAADWTMFANRNVGIEFEDESIGLGTAGTVTEVDFVGAGVVATRIGNKVTVTVAGGGGGISDVVFTNGLTESPTNTGELGGTLAKNTTITTTSSFGLTITGGGTTISLAPLAVYNTSGGLALDVSSFGGANGAVWAAGIGKVGSSAEIVNALFIANGTVAADGMGVVFAFKNRTSTNSAGTASGTSNELISQWLVSTDATRHSLFTIKGINSGTSQSILQLNGNGGLKLNLYTAVGSFSGTAVGVLGFDASGNILTMATPSGGAGGENLQQTLDIGSTLTSSETVQASTFTFGISGSGSSPVLQVDHTSGAGMAILGINAGSGSGVEGRQTGTGIAVNARMDNATTNTLSDVMHITLVTSGTPTAGIGSYLSFWNPTAASTTNEAARIVAKRTTVSASPNDDLEFWSKRAGTTTKQGAFLSTGGLYVDALAQDDAETKVVVWNSTDKIFEWRESSTLGGGGSGITIGTTTITGGTSTHILFNNAGVVGEYAISGTGSVIMSTGATFAASATVPAFSLTPIGSHPSGAVNAGDIWFRTNGFMYAYSSGVREFTWNDATQTLTNKTLTSPIMTSPSFTTIVSGAATLTLPTVAGAVVQKSFATITTNATWSPQGDASVNYYDITAQGAAVTTINAPSGTPQNGNELYIRVVDNGTARAIAGWNAIYGAGTNLAFPTTTTLGKYMVIKFVYNTMNSINKWQLVAVLDGL